MPNYFLYKGESFVHVSDYDALAAEYGKLASAALELRGECNRYKARLAEAEREKQSIVCGLADTPVLLQNSGARLAEAELVAASWKREAEINEWAINKLAEAKANEEAWEATAQHHYKEARTAEKRLAEAQEELAQWRATGESVTRNEHALAERLSNLRKWALDRILLPEELETIESGEWWENERD